MLTAVPKNDTLKYNSRVEKLNWDQVKFGEYNANDCKEKWKHIEKRLRGYRILEELLSDAKQWIEKPWTDFYRSGKKNRHPEMPKRPLTSYMLFYLDKKVKFAKKHPGLEMTSLSKLIAEKYKHLSQDKKDKYNALASNMREEYKEKMQKFLQDHPVEASRLAKNNSVGSNKKANVGMPGPVKPVPPFKLFLEDKVKHHKSDPDFVLAEFTTQCKNKWKTMSRKKKMPWIRWAHENELKYLEEVKLYKSENPNFEAPPLKSILSKEEKTILERMEGKPVKPPNSAYSLFSREMLNNPELKSKYETPKERMQEIAKLWKSVPKVEKNVYAEEVKRLIENYKMEYATYLDSLPEERREEELASNLPKRKPKGESQKLKVKDGVQLKIDTLLKKKSTVSFFYLIVFRAVHEYILAYFFNVAIFACCKDGFTWD
ncbi:hypothetical protein AAG570_006797 [Ranatra chinensis]|uniref:HMG box domain-containing protein n=1 Tax=Ranatra chinensis TaxID=642074 RepID=A0ABD0YV42_9HEMI